MSKSIGNIINIRDALKVWNKNIIRVFFLTHHYRTPVDLSNEKLREIEKTLLKVNRKLNTGKETSNNKAAADFKKLWISAMLDDFNTAKAFGYYFKYINESLLTLSNLSFIEEFENNMGIVGWRDEITKEDPLSTELDEDKIESLISDRNKAREQKDWGKADELRIKAEQLGIKLIDTKNGTDWEKIN